MHLEKSLENCMHLLICELCHNWISDFVGMCIGEIWWMCDYVNWCICALVDFCWCLLIFESGSNCMHYLIIRMYLMVYDDVCYSLWCLYLASLFDDNYFGNCIKVRIAYIYDLVIPLIMMISFSTFWNDELYLLSWLGKSLCDLYDWCC